MKASLKLKFDLGWIFSATLGIFLIIFFVARLSATYEIQNGLRAACNTIALSLEDTRAEYRPDIKEYDVELLTNNCYMEYKKDFVAVFANFDSWSFRDSYSKVYKSAYNK